MKKFLLCMMLAGLMIPVIAQEKLPYEAKKVHASEMMSSDLGLSVSEFLPVNPIERMIEVGEGTVAGFSKSYDRQTQGVVYPMTKLHDDGFIATTWTNEDNPEFEGSSVKYRGVAYSYSTDGGKTWSWNDESSPDYQLNRVGGIPLYWASYAQWGPNGEAILARSADTYEWNGMTILNGLVLLTRENKGVGEWNLAVVPYPEGTPPETNDEFVMAWSRMVTSGENHQYIQILTHVRGNEGTDYEGYYEPIFYYRTKDGGKTWDVEGKLVPDDIAGELWDKEVDPSFTDRISFASNGNVIACSVINLGYDAYYVFKSSDNGDTWTSIKFYESSVGWYSYPEEYDDTCFMPVHGNVAVDNNGKVHLAFSNRMVKNAEDEGYMSFYSGYFSSFLTYWNEDMGTFTGDDFTWGMVKELIYDHFLDDEKETENQLYVKSTEPVWPIIGFYVPTVNPPLYNLASEDALDWAFDSYNAGFGIGLFTFPQIAFDKSNRLHLAYAGLLDDGEQNGCWKRHTFYTATEDEGKTWTDKTVYTVNSIDYIDWEFAYLVAAGVDSKYTMILMSQVDPYPGTYQPYSGQSPDHGPTTNYYFFSFTNNADIQEVGYTPLTMNVYPNPASGQATVNFEGKGNITVYNMLGQTVYHVENVENTKTIPLNNMTTGVYFVTVRSGNATATQKLIVK